MLYRVSLLSLRPETTLDQDVYSERHVLLLRKGTVLSQEVLERFKEWGIEHVYTRSKLFPGEPPPVDGIDTYIESLADKKRELCSRAGLKPLVTDENMAKVSERAGVFFEYTKTQPLDVSRTFQLVEELSHYVDAKPESVLKMSSKSESRSYYPQRSVATTVLFLLLVKELVESFQELLELLSSSLLKDIGQSLLPHEITHKAGKLTEKEIALIRKHPLLTEKVLRDSGGLGPDAIRVAKHHHERADGTGYPDGLRGPEWHPMSHFLAICDVFDAVSTDRAYAKGSNSYHAMGQVVQMANSAFERKMVNRFVRMFGLYPTGTFMKLNSGEVGVVTAQNHANLVRPKVKILFDNKGDEVAEPIPVDLTRNDLLVPVRVYNL
jgi:HD-GYP domain-containing protein (c-di-GMP phosphodiesterase class II)